MLPSNGDREKRGLAAQSLWLRVLLFVSVAILAFGIVRCSIESTAPVAGAVSSVAVMAVRVDAPEGFFTQSGDSVAVVSAKWFARSFARASGIQVDIISSRDAIPETLAEDGGYDGLAYFVLDRVFNAERDEYMLSIHGEMVHAVSKRAMTTVDYELPPSFLYRKMTQAGVDMSRHMGYEPNAGGREDE